MPPKESHCCSTPLLVGTSSGISLRDGQSQATTWSVSLASQPPSEFTGFLLFKSMGWWLSGDLRRSVSLICALPVALLLRLGTSNYISEVGRCPRSAPCPTASQLHLHSKAIVPFIKRDILQTRGSGDTWELGQCSSGALILSLVKSPDWSPAF